MNTKLIYKRTRKASQNPEKRFSKTGDFFIAIGEALSSKNPKAELDKLAKKYDMQRKDLKEAVETYIKYDLDSNGLDDNDVKHLLKDAGFSDNDNESEEVKEFSSKYPTIDFDRLAREDIVLKVTEVLGQLFSNQPDYTWEGINYMMHGLNSQIKDKKSNKEFKDAIEYTIKKLK